jgi:hypothetical protein
MAVNGEVWMVGSADSIPCRIKNNFSYGLIPFEDSMRFGGFTQRQGSIDDRANPPGSSSLERPIDVGKTGASVYMIVANISKSLTLYNEKYIRTRRAPLLHASDLTKEKSTVP